MAEIKFWRIRLGDKEDAELWNLCKNENPPCMAVGWGKIDLSKNFDESEIKRNYEQKWEPLKGTELRQIKNWIEMKKGDIVIVMRKPGIICAIGKIIHERYHKEDDRFCMDIIVNNDKTTESKEVLFYNRIDVDWLTNPKNDNIKVNDTNLPKSLRDKLNISLTIIEIESYEYNKIKNELGVK